MKTKLLFIGAIILASLSFNGCTTNNISSADVNSMINGPNSIKGMISGKMNDKSNTPYSFSYDYHVTTNDGNSGSEGYVDNYTGDTLIYIWQYFYFDRNGYDDYDDNTSASGQFVELEFQVKVSTVKGVTKLTVLPNGTSSGSDGQTYNQRMYGLWENILSTGSRFVYGELYYIGSNSYEIPPTLDITGLTYDKNSQILSGEMNMSLADGNDVSNDSENYNATTITGDFKIYIPKENFEVFDNNGNNGNVYRKRAH